MENRDSDHAPIMGERFMSSGIDHLADAVIDRVRSELPDVWLGMRQRMVLRSAIAAALAERERAVWEQVIAKAEQAERDTASPEWILEWA